MQQQIERKKKNVWLFLKYGELGVKLTSDQ